MDGSLYKSSRRRWGPAAAIEEVTDAKGGVGFMALSPFRGFWDAQSEFDRMFNEMVATSSAEGARAPLLLRSGRRRWRRMPRRETW